MDKWPQVIAPYFQVLLQGITGEFGVPDACVPAGVARYLYTQKQQKVTFLTEKGHVPLEKPEKSLGLTVCGF